MPVIVDLRVITKMVVGARGRLSSQSICCGASVGPLRTVHSRGVRGSMRQVVPMESLRSSSLTRLQAVVWNSIAAAPGAHRQTLCGEIRPREPPHTLL